MLYEMVTGRVAFPAPTEFARLAALLSVEPEPIEQIDRLLAPLAPFLQRALRKNRDERFGSAVEMSRALAAVAPGSGGAFQGIPAAAHALDRLPEVASALAGSSPPPGSPIAPRIPGARQPSNSPPGTNITTLASPTAPTINDPAPQVLIIKSEPPHVEPAPWNDRTLRSSDPPRARRRGVSPAVVVLLVAVASAAGFLLGWAFGRS